MVSEKRLIDVNDVLEILRHEADVCNSGFTRNVLEFVITRIDSIKTVDAVEVVHGRWEQVQRWATKAKYRCSVCGREIMSATTVNIEKYPYCHCGAKMDGEQE